jgi:hypothetical protein
MIGHNLGIKHDEDGTNIYSIFRLNLGEIYVEKAGNFTA